MTIINRLVRGLLVIAAGATIIPRVEAGVIARWDFSSAATGPFNNYAPNPTETEAHILGIPGLSTTTPSGGSTITPSVTGGLFGYTYNGTPTKVSGNVINLTLTAGSATYSTLAASYTAAYQGDSFSGSWTYWVNNGTQNTLNSSAINNGANTVSFGGISLNQGDVLHLQFSLTGSALNGQGNKQGNSLGFDDLSISAMGISVVPEPTHYALAAFGLIFAGVTGGRRCWKRG